jgi:hypothetical protein
LNEVAGREPAGEIGIYPVAPTKANASTI